MGAASDGARHEPRRFLDPSDAEVPFDGTSPITWTLRANVLVVRNGKVLMVRQPPEWGGCWELPGGGVETDETLLAGAARECTEETGYQFIASSPAPFDVQEVWWGSLRGYFHGVIFIFQGDVTGDPDPSWAQDHGEIVQIAWLDPKHLSPATTRSLHWPALQKAGLV